MQLRAAFARGSDEADRKALIVRHRNESGFSVARKSLDADLFCIHGFVRLEIIECAARTPCPGAQSPPILRLPRLAFVHQADDAARQPGAVVRLNAVRADDRVAPTFGEHLLLPGGSSVCACDTIGKKAI